MSAVLHGDELRNDQHPDGAEEGDRDGGEPLILMSRQDLEICIGRINAKLDATESLQLQTPQG